MTVAMASILLVLTVTLTGVMNFLMMDSLRIRLAEIANHVSLEMAQLGSLCLASGSTDILILKKIELPTAIGIYGYTIELRNDTRNWVLSAYLDVNKHVTVDSPLWGFSQEFSIEMRNGTKVTDFGTIDYDVKIHSGSSKIVLWAQKVGSEVRLGMGELRS